MEKKNTMLLTVIAVATLLVAVVGATFAYFSLSVTGDSATISGTVKAPKAGTATITTATENLTLAITPEDMVEGLEDNVSYYAVEGTTDNSGSHGSENPIAISYAGYTGGATDTTYKCPVKVNVTAEGTMISENTLQEKWTSLVLQGEAVNKSTGSVTGTTWDSASNKLTIDLQKALSAGNGVMTGKSVQLFGEISLTGPSVKNKNILSASLSLINLKDVNQSAIAGQNLQVKIKVEPNGECTLQPAD